MRFYSRSWDAGDHRQRRRPDRNWLSHESRHAADRRRFLAARKGPLVAELKAALDRKREANGKCEGRKSYPEARPGTVALAKELEAHGLSYSIISAELAARGRVTRTGKPHVPSAVQKILGQ
jgi:hypothetical protein